MNEIDETREIFFLADGQKDGVGIRLKLLAHLGDSAEKISSRSVHLIDECNARNFVFVRLTPDRLGLRLNAGDGAEHSDRTIQDAE